MMSLIYFIQKNDGDWMVAGFNVTLWRFDDSMGYDIYLMVIDASDHFECPVKTRGPLVYPSVGSM